MQAYLDASHATGQLPLYDSSARERALEAGAFRATLDRD
jgi:hypothetical protein